QSLARISTLSLHDALPISSDMKAGVAVALKLAATVPDPVRDVTYVFYDCEEVAAELNGLKRVAEEHPDWLAADFAVLMEPTGGRSEEHTSELQSRENLVCR